MVVTCLKFLAAARNIVGPPISIFSIASSSVTSGLATVCWKGYKLTTTISIKSMCCSDNCSKCSGLLRSAKIPPCTAGCNVFTRPSIISGNCVNSDTDLTVTLASSKARFVPPVEYNS